MLRLAGISLGNSLLDLNRSRNNRVMDSERTTGALQKKTTAMRGVSGKAFAEYLSETVFAPKRRFGRHIIPTSYMSDTKRFFAALFIPTGYPPSSNNEGNHDIIA